MKDFAGYSCVCTNRTSDRSKKCVCISKLSNDNDIPRSASSILFAVEFQWNICPSRPLLLRSSFVVCATIQAQNNEILDHTLSLSLALSASKKPFAYMHLTWYFRHFHLFVHSFVFTVVVDVVSTIRTPLTHNFFSLHTASCRNKSDLQKALNFKCEKCSGLENERERIERHCDKVEKKG